MVAMGWLVYKLTNSPFLLAFIRFAGQIPAFLVAPIAGVFIDRYSKHKTIIVTQILSMIQALTLAYLVITNQTNIAVLIILEVILGVINGFDNPARQAFAIELVERREDLSNAIALNSSSFNAARLIGPGIAGILIALVGEGFCFLINGISFAAVIAALFAMKISPVKKQRNDKKIFHDLMEGFNYSFGFPPLRDLLLFLGLICLVGMPYTVLMPIFAKDILKGDAATLGILMSSIGIGALSGAFYLASRRSVLGLGKILVAAFSSFGVCIVIFSLSSNIFLSMLMLVVCGASLVLIMGSDNTIIQTIVDDSKRGKVMSIYIMIFMGMVPIGSLLAGSLASRIGAPYTLMVGGIVSIIGSIIFYLRLPYLQNMVRPIYIKLGIIPQVASAIQTASALTEPPEQQ